ncbi:hypothetical protein HMPREF1502_2871 [Klebsiella sp. AS10]|nr:hypothetical protein HMPREF1502_2871 [Klebsiella sp. AS10]
MKFLWNRGCELLSLCRCWRPGSGGARNGFIGFFNLQISL